MPKGKVLAKYYEEFYYSDIVEGIGTAYTKLPLFRSDEMLLARAEANTMLGKFDEALDDLNCFIELRIRPTISTSPPRRLRRPRS